jgi:hypothetical protein
MRPRHHVWGVLLGPVATTSISISSDLGEAGFLATGRLHRSNRLTGYSFVAGGGFPQSSPKFPMRSHALKTLKSRTGGRKNSWLRS